MPRDQPTRVEIVIETDDSNPDLLFIWAGRPGDQDDRAPPLERCVRRDRQDRDRRPPPLRLVSILADRCRSMVTERCRAVCKQRRR
jgi:hypothetical protein